MHSCANSPWDCAVVVLLVGTLIFKSEGKPAAVHIGEPVGFESVPVRAFGGLIELDTEGMNSFRVSVSINKDEKPLKTDTPMIPSGRTNKAKFTSVTDGSYKGIKASFGSVLVDDDSGALKLLDSNGKVLTTSSGPTATLWESEPTSACDFKLPGTDVTNPGRTSGCPDGLPNKTVDECCQACDDDKDCTQWVFATANLSPPPINCWLLATSGGTTPASDRIFGASHAPPPPPGTVSLTLTSSADALYYGAGSNTGDTNTLTATSSQAYVQNTAFMTPHYYSTDGYSALAVSGDFPSDPNNFANYPAKWQSEGEDVSWQVMGDTADFYLTPAATVEEGTAKYLELTGNARKLPLYAFGFMASRWGWVDRSYIESILTQFRNGSYPIDAWISDFEWYAKDPDYNLPSSGSPSFVDFWFNNITFPDPANNIAHDHAALNMKFGGIRKPRLGNSDSLVMARNNGWTIGQGGTGGAGGDRNLNYSIGAVRDWYAKEQEPLLHAGVDFWWNDEGETDYFTFYWWNHAETTSLASYAPTKRFFTINRAYTPGMQRMGLVTWTGDINPTWSELVATTGYILKWGLAGSPYVTCDIGGFTSNTNALLLTRWFAVGAYMPIMRVHSTNSATPHFPFLWGPDAAAAMKGHLETHYRLVPYHYSNAHALYENGTLLSRPLQFEFPEDSVASRMTTQWFDGPAIMATPVMNEDNSSNIYLPKGTWYTFDALSTSDVAVHTGPTNITRDDVALDANPAFAPAGSIVPLAPIVQHTGALPGGALEVRVYAGADAAYELVEDDGDTTAYEAGAGSAVRRTAFAWNDATATLTWSVSGSYAGSTVFVDVSATAFFADGSMKTAAPTKIGTHGSFKL